MQFEASQGIFKFKFKLIKRQVVKVNLVGIETKGAVQTSSPGSPGCDDDD